jgi:hypothetical protein
LFKKTGPAVGAVAAHGFSVMEPIVSPLPGTLFTTQRSGGFAEQGFQFFQHLSQNLFGDGADVGGLPVPPVQALYLIREDHARHRETVREGNLKRIALGLAGDGAEQGKTYTAVVRCR